MKQFSQAINVISQHRLLKVLDEASQAEFAGIANLRDYEAAEVSIMRERMQRMCGLL